MTGKQQMSKVTKLYFSYQTGVDRQLTDTVIRFGSAHYTYAIVAARVVALLGKLGLAPIELLRPEMFPSSLSLTQSAMEKPVHMIFKPMEHIRLLRGAYNIGFIYWEFNEINLISMKSIPFSNHLRMLSILDEIWVASKYSKQVLLKAGLTNVHVIPCPVAIPPGLPSLRPSIVFPDGTRALRLNYRPGRGPIQDEEIVSAAKLLAEFDRSRGKVFISVLNPHDWRKDIGSMLESFVAFLQNDPRHLLLIKCVVDDDIYSIGNLYDMIHYRFSSRSEFIAENIVFVSKRMSDQQMTAFFQYADFYFSTSRAEGQYLPLIEAMAQGCVAVAPANTAMREYIDDTDAIVIDTIKKRVNSVATECGRLDLYWAQASLNECVRRLEAASRISNAEYDALRRRAHKRIDDLFSEKTVGHRIMARLSSVRTESYAHVRH